MRLETRSPSPVVRGSPAPGPTIPAAAAVVRVALKTFAKRNARADLRARELVCVRWFTADEMSCPVAVAVARPSAHRGGGRVP